MLSKSGEEAVALFSLLQYNQTWISEVFSYTKLIRFTKMISGSYRCFVRIRMPSRKPVIVNPKDQLLMYLSSSGHPSWCGYKQLHLSSQCMDLEHSSNKQGIHRTLLSFYRSICGSDLLPFSLTARYSIREQFRAIYHWCNERIPTQDCWSCQPSLKFYLPADFESLRSLMCWLCLLADEDEVDQLVQMNPAERGMASDQYMLPSAGHHVFVIQPGTLW